MARCFLSLALMLVLACGDDDSSSGTTGSAEEDTMNVTSVWDNQQPIPAVYTCDGQDVSPPLAISAIPQRTQTLVLIVEDPDAPAGTFDHWIAYDIPPTHEIEEGVTDLGTPGRNSSGEVGYTGPCPPSGTHRYFFRVYALDTELGLPEGASKQEVLDASERYILGEGTLVGTYSR